MIALTPGKVLTPGDLYIVTRDANGTPVTPAYIAYSIYTAPQSGASALMSNPRALPQVAETGYFYVNMTVPTSWAEGTYKIVWYLKLQDTDDETQVVEEFGVVATKPGVNLQAPSMLMAVVPQTTAARANLIVSVRELLSDTNPDRNYHFRPPTSAKTIAGFSQRVGFIWDDVTILRMLEIAISRMNSANPKAMYGFNVDNLVEPYSKCCCVGAAAMCLTAEGCRWVADEFGYSLNGVSLDLQKSQNYLSLAASYKTMFDEWLPSLTANRPSSVGLRQIRWNR